MNINMLNSAERETLLLEVLTVLKTSIPNITRPGSVLINQAQPLNIEEKDGSYNVTVYVRAVDYAGKYIFLGPFYMNAKMIDGKWSVTDPRFDCGIDGCYYDIVGLNGIHLKFYAHMVVINEEAVYFEKCEGVTLKETDGEAPGVVMYHMKDGTKKPFYWDTTTQNPQFMEKLLQISYLMIDKAQKEAEEKAEKMKDARPGGPAGPAPETITKKPPLRAPVKRPSSASPFHASAGANAEPAKPKSPFVPLKNVTPDMEKPAPFDGPGILDTYIPEWSEDTPPYEPDYDAPPRPMTAESLSHLDDRKKVRSVVSSPEAEVEKYKRLLSIGAITADEFELKKRQLLGD